MALKPEIFRDYSQDKSQLNVQEFKHAVADLEWIFQNQIEKPADEKGPNENKENVLLKAMEFCGLTIDDLVKEQIDFIKRNHITQPTLHHTPHDELVKQIQNEQSGKALMSLKQIVSKMGLGDTRQQSDSQQLKTLYKERISSQLFGGQSGEALRGPISPFGKQETARKHSEVEQNSQSALGLKKLSAFSPLPHTSIRQLLPSEADRQGYHSSRLSPNPRSTLELSPLVEGERQTKKNAKLELKRKKIRAQMIKAGQTPPDKIDCELTDGDYSSQDSNISDQGLPDSELQFVLAKRIHDEIQKRRMSRADTKIKARMDTEAIKSVLQTVDQYHKHPEASEQPEHNYKQQHLNWQKDRASLGQQLKSLFDADFSEVGPLPPLSPKRNSVQHSLTVLVPSAKDPEPQPESKPQDEAVADLHKHKPTFFAQKSHSVAPVESMIKPASFIKEKNAVYQYQIREKKNQRHFNYVGSQAYMPKTPISILKGASTLNMTDPNNSQIRTPLAEKHVVLSPSGLRDLQNISPQPSQDEQRLESVYFIEQDIIDTLACDSLQNLQRKLSSKESKHFHQFVKNTMASLQQSRLLFRDKLKVQQMTDKQRAMRERRMERGQSEITMPVLKIGTKHELLMNQLINKIHDTSRAHNQTHSPTVRNRQKSQVLRTNVVLQGKNLAAIHSQKDEQSDVNLSDFGKTPRDMQQQIWNLAQSRMIHDEALSVQHIQSASGPIGIDPGQKSSDLRESHSPAPSPGTKSVFELHNLDIKSAQFAPSQHDNGDPQENNVTTEPQSPTPHHTHHILRPVKETSLEAQKSPVVVVEKARKDEPKEKKPLATVKYLQITANLPRNYEQLPADNRFSHQKKIIQKHMTKKTLKIPTPVQTYENLDTKFLETAENLMKLVDNGMQNTGRHNTKSGERQPAAFSLQPVPANAQLVTSNSIFEDSAQMPNSLGLKVQTKPANPIFIMEKQDSQQQEDKGMQLKWASVHASSQDISPENLELQSDQAPISMGRIDLDFNSPKLNKAKDEHQDRYSALVRSQKDEKRLFHKSPSQTSIVHQKKLSERTNTQQIRKQIQSSLKPKLSQQVDSESNQPMQPQIHVNLNEVTERQQPQVIIQSPQTAYIEANKVDTSPSSPARIRKPKFDLNEDLKLQQIVTCETPDGDKYQSKDISPTQIKELRPKFKDPPQRRTGFEPTQIYVKAKEEAKPTADLMYLHHQVEITKKPSLSVPRQRYTKSLEEASKLKKHFGGGFHKVLVLPQPEVGSKKTMRTSPRRTFDTNAIPELPELSKDSRSQEGDQLNMTITRMNINTHETRASKLNQSKTQVQTEFDPAASKQEVNEEATQVMLATAKNSQRSWIPQDPPSSQKQPMDTPSRQRPKKITIDAHTLLQKEYPEMSKHKTAVLFESSTSPVKVEENDSPSHHMKSHYCDLRQKKDENLDILEPSMSEITSSILPMPKEPSILDRLISTVQQKPILYPKIGSSLYGRKVTGEYVMNSLKYSQMTPEGPLQRVLYGVPRSFSQSPRQQSLQDYRDVIERQSNMKYLQLMAEQLLFAEREDE